MYWGTRHSVTISNNSNNTDNAESLIRSGFSCFPEEEYRTILNAIRFSTKKYSYVFDMGCGCGNLLGFIKRNIGYEATLIGVDFLEESISLAALNNPNIQFYCSNVIDYKPPQASIGCRVVLIDPYHYLDADLKRLIDCYIANNMDVILYTYNDVLAGLRYKTIMEFDLFKHYNASFFVNNSTISVAGIYR